MRPLTGRLLLWSTLLGCSILAYGWAWGWTPTLEGDSHGYLEVATDLADGKLESLHDRPVGYPLFLLLTGSAAAPGAGLLVSQITLHGLAVLLIVRLLRRLRIDWRQIAGLVFVAFLPPFVEHAGFVLSESLTQVFVVSGIAGFLLWLLDGRRSWLAISAASLALVGLVHPSTQLLWLVLPGTSLVFCALTRAPAILRRRATLGALALACAATSVLGGTIAWNACRFGFVGVSPMLGMTLSHKTVRVLELLPDEYSNVREILMRHRDAALLDPLTGHLGLAYIFRAVPDLETATGLHGAELSGYLVRMNLELIRRAPMDYVDEVLRSWVWYWAPGVTDRSGFGSNALKAAFNALRAALLIAFGLTVLMLAGPSVLSVQALLRSGPSVGPAGGPKPLLETLLVLCCILGAIAYSATINTALTAAVYRLRIPFDLPILACVCIGPAAWSQLRDALAFARRRIQ